MVCVRDWVTVYREQTKVQFVRSYDLVLPYKLIISMPCLQTCIRIYFQMPVHTVSIYLCLLTIKVCFPNSFRLVLQHSNGFW